MGAKFVTRVLAGWCAVGLLLLSACGGDEPSRPLDLDGENTEAAASETENEPSEETPDEPREGEVGRGANAASTPQEKEVTEAWFTYLEEYVKVLGTPDPMGFRLQDLANGPARFGPLKYAEELSDQDLRLRGGVIATVLAIEIDEGKAVIHGCIRTNMVEVDTTDKLVEKLTKPWLETKHTLAKWEDRWVVVDHDLDGAPKCA